MRVVEPVKGVVAFVNAQLELGDQVAVAWYSKYAFSLGTAECEDTVCEEGEDDRDLLMRVISFLKSEDGVKTFAEDRGVERSVLD